MKPKRTVWILGAGFSVPLGGGMLVDLLSLRQREAIRLRFPELASVDRPQAEEAMYTLYHVGAGFPEGHPGEPWLAMYGGAKLWRNAEEFIDYLDSTARAGASSQYQRLGQLWRAYWINEHQKGRNPLPQPKFALPPIESLVAFARRTIAAECLLFTDAGVQATERWSPYRRWGLDLQGSDTILTFNYDLVPERLMSSAVEGSGIGATSVVLDAEDEARCRRGRHGRCVQAARQRELGAGSQ